MLRNLLTLLVIVVWSASPEAQESLPQSMPTMVQIWKLHESGKHRDVIDAVSSIIDNRNSPPNRRAECMYLKGDNLRRLGEFKAAENVLQETLRFCRASEEPQPPFISTPYGKADIASLCELELVLNRHNEAGPFPDSSARIVEYAWKFYNGSRYDVAVEMAERCIATFGKEASRQQSEHERKFRDAPPKLEPGTTIEKEMWREYWALYDVGASYFIVGISCEREASLEKDKIKAAALIRKGLVALETAIADCRGAQCFDPSGPWYWRVKDAAGEKVASLKRMQVKLGR